MINPEKTIELMMELDKETLQYQVQFRGRNEIMPLIKKLESSEWEFDYFLSEQLLKVLQLVNYSQGLVVTFGREYSRVLYFQLSKGYPEIGKRYDAQLMTIQALNWHCDELDVVNVNNSEMIRIWWD